MFNSPILRIPLFIGFGFERTRGTEPRAVAASLFVLAFSAFYAGLATAQLVVELDPVATQVQSPIAIRHSGDDSGRLFIVSQTGEIHIFENGRIRSPSFLDLSSKFVPGGERGLLGLAFDPDYLNNRRFFVYYTDAQQDTVVSRFLRDVNDPRAADASSEQIILQVDQPDGNHNGGDLHFGPDGYLYVSLGDGGGSRDPNENGGNPLTLLGAVLRIDTSSGSSYTSPDGNPFKGSPAGRDEIWAYGLRNPWRMSFDRETGDLFVADVGQQFWEEVNLLAAGSGGDHLGWDECEGTHPFDDRNGEPDDPGTTQAQCSGTLYDPPILEYDHDVGCAVIGGVRYRNPGPLYGYYLYADWCSGRIWGAAESTRRGIRSWSTDVLADLSSQGISAFGESQSGAVYMAYRGGLGERSGVIYRVVAGGEIYSDGFESGTTTQWSSSKP